MWLFMTMGHQEKRMMMQQKNEKKTCHQQIITCNHVKKADFKIIVSLFKSTNILSCTWNLEVP